MAESTHCLTLSNALQMKMLDNLKPVDNLSFNYVLSGFQKKIQKSSLKSLCNPSEVHKEASVIKASIRHGMVQLLAQTNNALLLERAIPGVFLKTYFFHKQMEGFV